VLEDLWVDDAHDADDFAIVQDVGTTVREVGRVLRRTDRVGARTGAGLDA